MAVTALLARLHLLGRSSLRVGAHLRDAREVLCGHVFHAAPGRLPHFSAPSRSSLGDGLAPCWLVGMRASLRARRSCVLRRFLPCALLMSHQHAQTKLKCVKSNTSQTSHSVGFHSHAHAAMLATCNAYRAHRHGSESPYPGSTPGLNPCNHLAWLACGPLADTQTQLHTGSRRLRAVWACGSRGWRVGSPDRLAHEVVGRQRQG